VRALIKKEKLPQKVLKEVGYLDKIYN